MDQRNRKKTGGIMTIWVLAMLLIPAIFTFLPDSMDLELRGVVSNTTPDISAEAFWNGTCQSGVESYLSENLGLRGVLIRIGNQARYSLFRSSTHEGECLGKNGQIYELEYVYKKTQLTPPVSQEYIDDRIARLEAIQEALGEKGIHLFIFVTPSKAEIYPEDMPDIYIQCAPKQQESSYELLLKGLEQSSVPYFDSVPYVMEQKAQGEKVYALTGTHWTQSTGAKVSAQLARELGNAFGYDMTEYTVQEVPTDDYLDPDADVFNLLNILQKPYDVYTRPQIEVTKTGTQCPGIFCRGGSFMGQTITYLIQNGAVSEGVHMENTYVYTEQYSQVQFFSDYEEIDVEKLLEDKDILLLEVNQAAIDKMSFGFIDYLYENYVEKGK